MSKNDRYTYRITWSEEGQEYVGLCVEFPRLTWLDKKPKAALAGIRNMVAETVQDMIRAASQAGDEGTGGRQKPQQTGKR